MKALQVGVLILLILVAIYHVIGARDRYRSDKLVKKTQNPVEYNQAKSETRRQRAPAYRSISIGRSDDKAAKPNLKAIEPVDAGKQQKKSSSLHEQRRLEHDIAVLNLSWQGRKDMWEELLKEISIDPNKVTSVTNAGVCAVRLNFVAGESPVVYFDALSTVESELDGITILTQSGKKIALSLADQIRTFADLTGEIISFCEQNREIARYVRGN